MKLSQVGAQLYTVRDHLKDPTAFVHMIDRLKGFDYRAMELIHSETVSDQEIAKICDCPRGRWFGSSLSLNGTQRAARISKEAVGIHFLLPARFLAAVLRVGCLCAFL